MKETIWETKFRLSMSNNEELMGICEGYSEVDDTFTFEVRGKSPSLVVISSSDEKQAFRRGMSIKRKLITHEVTPTWFKLKEAKN